VSASELQQANQVLQRLERFWNSPAAYGGQVAGSVAGTAA
jgi:hypothetical protein